MVGREVWAEPGQVQPYGCSVLKLSSQLSLSLKISEAGGLMCGPKPRHTCEALRMSQVNNHS